MSTPDPAQQAFKAAYNDFKKSLANQEVFRDVSTITTINQAWDKALRIQAKQVNERRMRHMAKMQSFLKKLETYDKAVGTFVQVKPDVLALIWGPVNLLLGWASNVALFADAINEAMKRIGDALPESLEMAEVFKEEKNERLEHILALFYGDILDFYVILLRFFKISRATIFFESLWPRRLEEVNEVVKNITHHTTLLRDVVTLQHIREEHAFRTKAIAAFREEAQFRELEKFRALRTHVSPRFYDDRLDWLLTRSSETSADWLFQVGDFKRWIDVSNPAVRLLWLRGIPGAGKTFLSAAAVGEAKKHHRTLFVFVSNAQESSATAKAALQSLLFQLAWDDEDVQTVLTQAKEQALYGSTQYIVDMLKTSLGVVGATYIILDGLDEMETSERGVLLQQLTGLSECSELKILVSSRPEDDIANILDGKATSIRVEQGNAASIQSYVKKRTESWVCDPAFDEAAQKLVRRLVAPVADKANGMFLYARIVLDNAELLTGLEEIERDLEALPADLDEVYRRTFTRLNESPPYIRSKAVMILGWIGCSPIPMARQEMEQALLVDSRCGAPSVIGQLNFVRICGSVIELADDMLQFVHFTVKEYIFSQQVKDFVGKAEANYGLTKVLLTYLCSGFFVEALPSGHLEEAMLEGRYRLHWFATSQWINLVKHCIQESEDLSAYPDLLEMLARLATELDNPRFDSSVDFQDRVFRKIQLDHPSISRAMRGVLQFRKDDQQVDWNFSNSGTWVDSDPTVLSTMSARVDKCLENLLACSEDKNTTGERSYATLTKHYGLKMFKCVYPSCGFSRLGFTTRKERECHVVEMHSPRPWKCTEPSCQYADIGFKTIQDKWKHCQKHRQDSALMTVEQGRENRLAREEDEAMLFELVRAGNVNELEHYLQLLKGGRYKERFNLPALPAALLAAKIGSRPMLEMLGHYHQLWRQNEAELGRAIINSGNSRLFRWFLDEIVDQSSPNYRWGSHTCSRQQYVALACYASAADSPEVYAEWDDFLFDSDREITELVDYVFDPPLRIKRADQVEWLLPTKLVVLFSAVFKAVKNNALFEARLVQTWRRLVDLRGRLDPVFLGWSLWRLAQTSLYSTRLAAELLSMGALINFPRVRAGTVPATPNSRQQGTMLKGMTALHYASRGTSEQAVRFTRFLLEEGADPSLGWDGSKPQDEKAASLMPNWLDESWEEVVERAGEARRKRKREQETEDGDNDADD